MRKLLPSFPLLSALLSALTLFALASAGTQARASTSASDIIQPAGVGSASWPGKCPDVIDTQKTDQPKILGFIFNGETFTRLADGSASAASSVENVIGCYADLTAMSKSGSNNWQIGTISRDSTGYYWQNSAGVKWGLTFSKDRMITDTRNPYYATAKEFVFTLDPNLKYFGVLGIAGSMDPNGGPGYYVNASLESSIPTNNRSGFGWYSSLFPLISSPVQGFQLGLSSTWIEPNFASRDANISQKLCATGTDQWVKSVASDPSYGTYGYDLMQTLEGSLGWWANEKYPSAFPKYEANATQNCYTTQLATPGWGFFSDKPTSQNATGLVQLSNQVLLPPDGMTFQQDSTLPQLGVTWLSLPLPTFDHKYGNMAGTNAWTLFMKTGNFSGPVQFVAPQFWADGSISNPIQKGLTLDALTGSMGQLSSEWNSIPYFEDKGSDGTIYSKLPQLQLPSDSQGKLTFSRDLMAYSSSAVASEMAKSLINGSALPAIADPAGVKAMSLVGQSSQVFQHGESVPYLTKLLATSSLNSGSAFGLSLPSSNTTLQISQYFASKNGTRVPVDQSQVPAALASASFSPTSKPTFVYQSPGWWDSSPSASDTYSVQLNDGSSVDYKWYKFVDQPSLQRFELDSTERANLQAAAEKIQKEWSATQLIKNPSQGTLANFDSGLLVKPPKGLEIGYVPIVIKQYFGAPTPAPSPTPSTTNSPVATSPSTATPTPKATPAPTSSTTSQSATTLKKTTITCVKGKLTKKVTAIKPVCPAGYKKK